MEERPPLKIVLLFVNFGILLVFFATVVESQQQQNGTQTNLTSSKPPSRLSHSPSPAPSPRKAPPLSHSPSKSPNELKTHSQSNHHNRKGGLRFNLGQKIGLIFAGIVAILQVGVVGFLAFKRRQLLKMHDR